MQVKHIIDGQYHPLLKSDKIIDNDEFSKLMEKMKQSENTSERHEIGSYYHSPPIETTKTNKREGERPERRETLETKRPQSLPKMLPGNIQRPRQHGPAIASIDRAYLHPKALQQTLGTKTAMTQKAIKAKNAQYPNSLQKKHSTCPIITGERSCN